MNDLTRRELLQGAAGAAWAASAAAAAGEVNSMPDKGAARATGLCLNEDDSHYFYTRAGQKLDAAAVDSWVDQYAGTQVRELMLCPNCMRASYASKVWDPLWRGYDPDGPDDQPLFASLPPGDRPGVRGWVHTAWQLARDGIDVYARWIARARRKGISPWLSMRMNDVHNVDDERSFIHSEFWRQHPELRRVPYRFAEWTDRAFDYGRPEVRAWHMALIRELAERYDFDGLELDWMRFGFHFRPGHETEGAELLTQFTAGVRRLLDRWGRKRGHRIRLGARVASRPQTALGLGMDAVTWARRGLVDMLVITPFWASAETDMPVEMWRELLRGTKVTLAAGLELLLRPYPEYAQPPTNSLETVRGAAASLLDRGADRIYLFNYMDSQTAMEDMANYPALLRECGSPETLAGKPRRHVMTYADTWAPGEPRAIPLPVACAPGRWNAFRLPTGPKTATGKAQARLGIEGASEPEVGEWEVRVNGERCVFTGAANPGRTGPTAPVFGFDVPLSTMQRGYNLIEVAAKKAARIVWVEMAITP
jgi:hypothetical protein